MAKFKKIMLPVGDIIKVRSDIDIFGDHSIKIQKGYFSDGVSEKIIKFEMGDDFAFEGYSYDIYRREVQNISFDFNVDDPLYIPISTLLMGNNQLIIDDDKTPGVLRKYMEIKKEEDNITIKFQNNMVNDKDYDFFHKWKVFIKNVSIDPRSKIKDNNIKISLIEFFEETAEHFFENDYKVIVDDFSFEIKNQKEKILKK